jgi:hypothetical protein
VLKRIVLHPSHLTRPLIRVQVQHVNIVPLLGSSKDGMVPCLVYALMEGGSLQDRLACRGSGALVPLTVNERILVLSDSNNLGVWPTCTRRCMSFTVTSRAQPCCWTEVARAASATLASLDPSTTTTQASVTHMQTERVMGTQVNMAPEYIRGELSAKVDAFAYGLVVIETLTGYAVCSPAPQVLHYTPLVLCSSY